MNVKTEFVITLPESSTSVTAVLHSLVDGSTIQCEVTDEGSEGGRYVVAVLPTSRGRHELIVTSNGITVEGSPINILVCCPPQLLGRPVRIIEGVNRPAGVALCGNTELVVTEIEPAAVSIRDRQGKLLKSFEQELDNPYGVATDSEECVYVAELINCKIHKFSNDGTSLKSAGGECNDEGSNLSHVAFPAGIKINSNDHIYVCDDTNKKVYVLDKNLDMLFSFGEGGDDLGHFQSPSDIAFDADGNVFVADTKRRQIMKFSPQGKFITEFEMKGQSSELELGICIGPSGDLYVSDFWNHRVVVFDSVGRFITEFGKAGSEPGEFDMPAGITIDEDGYVYVCDQMNSRIQVF